MKNEIANGDNLLVEIEKLGEELMAKLIALQNISKKMKNNIDQSFDDTEEALQITENQMELAIQASTIVNQKNDLVDQIADIGHRSKSIVVADAAAKVLKRYVAAAKE